MKKNPLATFLNRADERCFNDALVIAMAVEIRLQSGKINEDLILPAYRRREYFYNGEHITHAAPVSLVCPKKALEQTQQIVCEGGKLGLKTYTEIRQWMQNRLPDVNSCCLMPISSIKESN